MEKNSQDFSVQKAMELAKSPAGQQLLAMLKQSDSNKLQQAAAFASAGDYAKASQALQAVLSSPEAKRLMETLGGSHG